MTIPLKGRTAKIQLAPEYSASIPSEQCAAFVGEEYPESCKYGVPGKWSLSLRFSQFNPGLVLRSEPRLVTGEEIIEFASRYDPQWFHKDVVKAKKGRWGGIIASGWHTCAIATQLTVEGVLKDSDTFGSSNADHIKWLHPVRPDDQVALRFEVLRLSKSPSGRTGILLAKSELWNQSDRLVFSMETTTLFEIANQLRRS